MSLVSSPITDKSSSAPLSLSLSRCIFLSSGSGQGTPEITRLGPGPASCQLTRKIPIPGLNWLTLAAKYFAKTDCEYFRNRNILGGGTGAEIYDRWCLGCGAVCWLPHRNNLRYLMANSHIDPRKPGASPPGRAGQAASRHKICKQTGPSQCLQKVWYSQSFVCAKQLTNPRPKASMWKILFNNCDCNFKRDKFLRFF